MWREKLLQILLIIQLISSLFSAADVHLKRQKRIVHGIETSIEEFPHQVSLRLVTTSKHFCGGAILSDMWIATAAQCTQGSKSSPENIFVIVGATNITQKNIHYDLEKVVNHPNFNWAKRQNDIALLKTDRPMLLSDRFVFPIDLPTFKTDYYIENGIGLTYVTLSGWGSVYVYITVHFILSKKLLSE